MRISFIIPAYNLPPQLLSQCLSSILALPLAPDEREIIVVDDGSDTPVAPLLPPGVISIRQANNGLSAARNTGLHRATGHYIQFVDGDDQLITPTYTHCLEVLRRETPDILFFHLTRTPPHAEAENPSLNPQNEGLKTKNAEQIPTPPIVNPSKTKALHYPSGAQYISHSNLRAAACGYLFSRHLATNLRFEPHILHEDELFTPLLTLRAHSVIELPLRAYYYRRRPQSITTTQSEPYVQKRLIDKKNIILRLLATAPTLSAPQRQALERRATQMTADIIIDALRSTRSIAFATAFARYLHTAGLLPLAPIAHSWRHNCMRLMLRANWSTHLLFRIDRMLHP